MGSVFGGWVKGDFVLWVWGLGLYVSSFTGSIPKRRTRSYPALVNPKL